MVRQSRRALNAEEMMDNVRKGFLLLLLVCTTIILSGCATLFNEKEPAVSFMSDPSSAQVYVNGANMGETPCTIRLKTNKEYTIEFRKDGYQTKTYFLTNEVGALWIVLDVLAGFVPIIVDAATGAWYDFSEENIVVVLEQ